MRKLIFALVILCQAVSIFAQNNGSIKGVLTDAKTGEPLIGASLVIKGTTNGSSTDLDGRYAITNLNAASYNLQVSYISFETKTINGVEVKAGQVTILNIKLAEASLGLKEIEVEAKAIQNTENALMTIKRRSVNVIDGISSAQFQLAGDNDAGAAARRITGLSVEGGKYIYVRGLGDRYSKTTLNKATIPGLDPNRNTIQMDLFPANLIDNLVAYKNFTPDLPGDFTGGLVNITTKDFPEQFNMQISSSFGYNPQANFNKDFLTYKGGKLDWLGIDDGSRAFPKGLENGVPTRFLSPESDDKLTMLTQSFNKNWVPNSNSQFLNQSHSFSLGNQIKIGKMPFGFVTSASYQRSFESYKNGETGRYKLTGLDTAKTLNTDLTLKDSRSTDNVLWGVLLNGTLKISSLNKVGVMFMRNQNAEKTTRYQEGFRLADANDLFYQTRSLFYQTNSLTTIQLKGDHFIPLAAKGDLKMDWNSTYSSSVMEQPDLRFFTNGYYGPVRGYEIEPSIGQIPSRYNRNMLQTNIDNQLNFTYSFKQWSNLDSKIKFGASYLDIRREFREKQYRFDQNGTAFSGDPLQYMANDNAWSSNNLNGVFVVNAYEAANNYQAYQQVGAAYAMTELALSEKLKTIVGVRAEQTKIQFYSFDRFTRLKYPGLNGVDNILSTLDLLPSLSFTYELNKIETLRFGYGRTLARPTFRELAPFASFDFIGDFVLVGNPNLKRTLVDNIDARWEKYLKPGELVSGSVFYKRFANPIERSYNPIAANPEFIFRNVDKADLYGVELEFRKKLDFISKYGDRFEFGTNVTFVKSVVDIAPAELENIRVSAPNTNSKRAMFGQSPYVVNSYLNYADTSGWSANVNFNVSGERLSIVMLGGTPNVYEMPRPVLDFNIGKKLTQHWSMQFRARNLLDSKYRLTQTYKATEYNFQSYSLGRNYSFSLKYNF